MVIRSITSAINLNSEEPRLPNIPMAFRNKTSVLRGFKFTERVTQSLIGTVSSRSITNFSLLEIITASRHREVRAMWEGKKQALHTNHTDNSSLKHPLKENQ